MWQKHCQLGLKRTGKVGQMKEHCWISGILMNGTTDIHLWTSVLQGKDDQEGSGDNQESHSYHSPWGRLFQWFPKVRLAQCLWVRMLLPSCPGQDHPAELQRWGHHLEMWRWLLSPDTEPWARRILLSFTTWWNFAWLEPIVHFYFHSPFGMGPSVLCLCPPCLVRKHISCLIHRFTAGEE